MPIVLHESDLILKPLNLHIPRPVLLFQILLQLARLHLILMLHLSQLPLQVPYLVLFVPNLQLQVRHDRIQCQLIILLHQLFYIKINIVFNVFTISGGDMILGIIGILLLHLLQESYLLLEKLLLISEHLSFLQKRGMFLFESHQKVLLLALCLLDFH